MPDRPKTLLIVDADEASRDHLASAVTSELRVLRVASGEAALHAMEKEDVDVLIFSTGLPGIKGLDLLKIVKENYPYVACIVLAAVQEFDTVIEATRHGADSYLTHDAPADMVRSVVTKAIAEQGRTRDLLRLNEEVTEQHERPFVGASAATRELVELAQRVAAVPATVLILGESGTGKELLARLIHRHGGNPARPFVAVNLAAIPHELVESTLFGHEKGAFTGAVRQQLGKFELANGGTLFLDEVGDLRLDLQAKLLRALQENEIERVGGTHPIKTDFRLIAATNVDLEKAVKEGRFRGDLFFRLNVIPMRIPPLRNRIDDLPELARFFLRRYNQKFRKQVRDIADSTLKLLSAYWWPGNIRELENLIERLVAISDKEWITDADLPYEFHIAELEASAPEADNQLERAVTTFERNFIVRALDKNGWNVTATARTLGIPLSTLKFKIDKLGVRRFRGE